jgi:hypothetical protein
MTPLRVCGGRVVDSTEWICEAPHGSTPPPARTGRPTSGSGSRGRHPTCGARAARASIAATARPTGSPPRRPTRTPSSAPDGLSARSLPGSCCNHRENPRFGLRDGCLVPRSPCGITAAILRIERSRTGPRLAAAQGAGSAASGPGALHGGAATVGRTVTGCFERDRRVPAVGQGSGRAGDAAGDMSPQARRVSSSG